MLDTPSLMASARRLIPPPLTTSDALSGVTESAPSAPRDGSSTLLRFAPQSAISAQPGMMPPESAHLATMDPSSNSEPAFPANRPPSMPSQTTFFARPGQTTPALSAPIEPSSTTRESALLSAHSALLSTRPLEIALPASMAMTMLREAVSILPLILPPPLILDAPTGIGKDKNAFHAPRDGHSMITTSVCQLLISVPHTMIRENARPASRDMTLRMENASSLCPTTLSPLTLDAEPGIGTTKFASPAPADGSSTLTRSAPQFLTNAPATITTELA